MLGALVLQQQCHADVGTGSWDPQVRVIPGVNQDFICVLFPSKTALARCSLFSHLEVCSHRML